MAKREHKNNSKAVAKLKPNFNSERDVMPNTVN
jgi:hypothetical protein